jgi:hypothetical protein
VRLALGDEAAAIGGADAQPAGFIAQSLGLVGCQGEGHETVAPAIGGLDDGVAGDAGRVRPRGHFLT